MGSDTESRSSKKEQKVYWGKSLPVQSVQELVRTNSTHVPDRYIRDLGDRHVIEHPSQSSLDVPVIDFSLLCGQSERQKLHQACRDWGFFQVTFVINPPIALSLLARASYWNCCNAVEVLTARHLLFSDLVNDSSDVFEIGQFDGAK